MEVLPENAATILMTRCLRIANIDEKIRKGTKSAGFRRLSSRCANVPALEQGGLALTSESAGTRSPTIS
jgi:hypothetical protein